MSFETYDGQDPMSMAAEAARMRGWGFAMPEEGTELCQLCNYDGTQPVTLDLLHIPDANQLQLSISYDLWLYFDYTPSLEIAAFLNLVNIVCQYGGWHFIKAVKDVRPYSSFVWRHAIDTDVCIVREDGIETAAVNSFLIYEKCLPGIQTLLANHEAVGTDEMMVVTALTQTTADAQQALWYTGPTGHC